MKIIPVLAILLFLVFEFCCGQGYGRQGYGQFGGRQNGRGQFGRGQYGGRGRGRNGGRNGYVMPGYYGNVGFY